MAVVNNIVDDVLLRELSAETRKVGTKVLAKKTKDFPAYMADIIDVIILPHSEFYREKFMVCYYEQNQNSVKALKELNRNFPFVPDYQLGIGYILGQTYDTSNISNCIKIKVELDLVLKMDETETNPLENGLVKNKNLSSY
jgi:hypothetical protein